MNNERHGVFNFVMNILDAHTMSQKLDRVFEKLECATKLNIAFGCVLKYVEDGTCQCNYANQNNTLIDGLKLVTTKGDLIKIRNVLSNTDVFEACTTERITQWTFYKLTNFTVFAALLKRVPMGCTNAVLPEALAKNTLLFVYVTKRIRENRTMTIYASLQLSLCIRVEIKDI